MDCFEISWYAGGKKHVAVPSVIGMALVTNQISRGEMQCAHDLACKDHGTEHSKGSLVPPPTNLHWIYGNQNPLMVSSVTGGNKCLHYAKASLNFPDSIFRPLHTVTYHYDGACGCPIVDSNTAIFEIHLEGPFLSQRREMLRNKIVHSKAFADGNYAGSLTDGFESMNEELLASIKNPKEDRRLWGCGRFSMVVLVHKNTICTAGASAVCLVLRKDEKIVLPEERSSIVCNVANLKRTGKLLDQGEHHFKAAVLAMHKIQVDSGDHLIVAPHELIKLGEVEKLCRAGLEKGCGLREICLDTLDHSGMMAIGVTTPLVLAKIN